ncbi:6902_t:CDS:2 [Diversispora eburnea]|uniref:THO complex subunit 2 n=1 Tax=Diversispora eburnea TaxID=1213867 RepID=A0A9N8V602_9GLOM|nr:6902_t:CDS:2 [Diversispora eburnea]
MENLEQTITESLFNILEGEKEVDHVDVIFKDLPVELNEKAQEIVLDTLWTYDHDIVPINTRDRLVKLVKRLHILRLADVRAIKTKLEVPLLEAAEVVEPQVWGRKCIRINTALTYKQQKYNLLREESEGYAKLLHEINLYCIINNGVNDETLNQRANTLLETIKTLIDPNRVLDIILDEFVYNVKPHHEFFLRLLEISPWQPSDFANKDKGIPISDDWSRDSGNLNCAELLATKYTRYEGPDMDQDIYQSLYITSALLINRGLVKISDLYPHIKSPPVPPTTKSSNSFSGMEDDSSFPSNREQHQKGLVCALLEIGDFQHACYLLLQLESLDEHIAKYLCEILKLSIFKIYNPIAPIKLKEPKVGSHIGTWYKRWKEGFPVFYKFEDLFEASGRLLIGLIGPWFAKNLILLSWILRICYNHIVEARKSKNNKNNLKYIESNWWDIIRITILPAMTMSGMTVGVLNEVWDILKFFPVENRFGLWSEWRRVYDQHEPLRERRKKATKKLIKFTNAMTSEDYKQKAREIALVTHSRPTVAFDFILRKVKMNPDLIDGMVEVCKYLTRMDFDVLTYMFVESIIEESRPKLKEDGVNPSDWMYRMAIFIGKVCSKYERFDSENIAIILEYVLIKLREQYTEIPSDTDLIIMAGGEHLRDTKLFNRNVIKSYRKASMRLANALMSKGIVTEFAALLAQMTQSVPFDIEVSSTLDLKSVIGRADICRRTFIQYVDFLAVTLDMEKFALIVPSIIELCKVYALKPEYAFSILRPFHNHFLKKKSHKSRESKNIGKHSTPERTHETSKQNGHSDLSRQVVTDANNTSESEPMIWRYPLYQLFDQVKEILPPYVWNGISPSFYTSFWQLSLYDLEFPRAEYNKAIQECQNHIMDDVSKDVNKYTKILKYLEDEYVEHGQHMKAIEERLKIEKEHWFSGQFSNRQDIITQLWQYCLFPRLLISPDNAIFCAKFIERMHKIGTANFSTLTLYDRIFADQLQLITFTCSEAEARNYGLFLKTILQSLSSLHRDEKIYNEIGKGKGIPGFQMKWSSQNRQPASVSETDLLGFQDFRRVFYKWHSKLYKAFEQGLQSQEYLSLRNSIIVISTIHEYFPAIDIFGKKVENLIKNVISDQHNKWKDIEVLAISYSARLQSDKKNWVGLEDFRHTENNQQNSRPGSSASQGNHSTSAQKIAQSHVVNRVSSPLPNVKSAHSSPSHPNTMIRTDSPRRQIHPLPDKPQDRIQVREKERDREREEDRDKNRMKDKKEIMNDREKDIKRIDDHKDAKKSSDHHERDRGRDRDRKPEILRLDGEKRKASKERLLMDDRNKRADYHPRPRDRDIRDREDKVKEREKREDRREDRREDKHRDRHRNDNGRSRRHLEDNLTRRPRKNDHDLIDRNIRDDRDMPFTRNDRGDRSIAGPSKKRDRSERDRDEEPDMISLSKKRTIRTEGMGGPIPYPSNPKKRERVDREIEEEPESITLKKGGLPPIPRPPVKLNRSVEHITELMQPMPFGKGDKRRRY